MYHLAFAFSHNNFPNLGRRRPRKKVIMRKARKKAASVVHFLDESKNKKAATISDFLLLHETKRMKAAKVINCSRNDLFLIFRFPII